MKRLSMAMTGLAVLGLMTMVSCRKPNVNNAIPGAPRTVTFNATTESNGGSKTYLEGLDVKWNENDVIYVNGTETGNQLKLASEPGSTSGSFSSESFTAAAPYMVAYPQPKAISQSQITFTITDKQNTYNEDGEHALTNVLPMAAHTAIENDNLVFQNMVNILQLNLTGNQIITEIEVSSTEENLSGDFTVNSSLVPTAINTGTITKKITITKDMTLSSTAQTVYVVLPVFEKSESMVTVKFTGTEGEMTGSFELKGSEPGSEATTPNHRYTMDVAVSLVEPVETDEWINFNDATMGVSGLPKWAKKSIGATCSTENTKDPNTAATWYGDYYAWGATTTWYTGTASSHTWKDGYSDGYVIQNDPHYNKDYWMYKKYTSDDDLTTLEDGDDVAHTSWGGSWRMPTRGEWKQLVENTLFVWTDNYKGINDLKGYVVYKVKATAHKGQKVTSSGNGDYNYRKTEYALTDPHMFLPIAGRFDGTGLTNTYTAYYWSKSIGSDPYYASYLFFTKTSDIEWYAEGDRYYGCSVRPVQ